MQDNITIEIAARFTGQQAVQGAIQEFGSLQGVADRTGADFIRMKMAADAFQTTLSTLTQKVREHKLSVDEASQQWSRFIGNFANQNPLTMQQLTAAAVRDPRNMSFSTQSAQMRQEANAQAAVLSAQMREQEAAQRRVTAAARETTAETQRHSSLIGGAMVGNLIRVVFAYHAVRAAAQGVANTVGQVFKTIERGAEIELVEQRFNNLAKTINTTGPRLMSSLTDVSSGMQSRFQLMEGAVKFTTLGFAENEQQAARLVNVASQLNWNMNQVVLTMANLSWRRLDSLSLSIDAVRSRMNQLREAGMSTQQAFREAVILEGEAKVTTYGDVALTTAGKINMLKASWNNFKDAIATSAVDAAAEDIANLADSTKSAASGFDLIAQSAGTAIGNTGGFIANVLELIALQKLLTAGGGSKFSLTNVFLDALPSGVRLTLLAQNEILDRALEKYREVANAQQNLFHFPGSINLPALFAAGQTPQPPTDIEDFLRQQGVIVDAAASLDDKLRNLGAKPALELWINQLRESGKKVDVVAGDITARIKHLREALGDDFLGAVGLHDTGLLSAVRQQEAGFDSLRLQTDRWRDSVREATKDYQRFITTLGPGLAVDLPLEEVMRRIQEFGAGPEMWDSVRAGWKEWAGGFTDTIKSFKDGVETMFSTPVDVTFDNGVILDAAEATEQYTKKLEAAQQKLQLLMDTQGSYHGTAKQWQNEVNRQQNLIDQYTIALDRLNAGVEAAGGVTNFGFNLEKANENFFNAIANSGIKPQNLAALGVYLGEFDAQQARAAVMTQEINDRIQNLVTTAAEESWSVPQILAARDQLFDSIVSGAFEQELAAAGVFDPIDLVQGVNIEAEIQTAGAESIQADAEALLREQFGDEILEWNPEVNAVPEINLDASAAMAQLREAYLPLAEQMQAEIVAQNEKIFQMLSSGGGKRQGHIVMPEAPDVQTVLDNFIAGLDTARQAAAEPINIEVLMQDTAYQAFREAETTFRAEDKTVYFPVIADPDGNLGDLIETTDTFVSGSPYNATVNLLTGDSETRLNSMLSLLGIIAKSWTATVTINERTVKTTVDGGGGGTGGGGTGGGRGRNIANGINIQQTIVNEMVPLDAGKIAKSMQTGMEAALNQLGF